MAYSPALHSLTGKPMGMSQATPTDARSYFYDTTNFVYRPYVSTAEVLTYLNLAKYRFGDFPIYLNTTGTLNGDGTFTGGRIVEYIFKNGTADSNLAVSNPEVFDVTHYGANPNNASDDSAAIIAAMTACAAAGGGTVYFPLPRNSSGYHYIVSSALITSQDGINPNAQIVIPLFTNTGDTPTIVFRGEVPPAFTTEGIVALPRSNAGVIIESTILGTGTKPAVFGTSYYASGTWGDRNFVKVIFENIIVRTRTITAGTDIAGSMCAINFAKLINFESDELKADISSSLTDSVSPASANTFGIIYPDVNNKADMRQGNVWAEGYTRGIVPGEHFNAQSITVAGCTNGLAIDNGHHSISIQHFTAEVCNNNIALDGTGSLSIFNYETEHYAGSEWFAFASDIKKNAGSTEVKIFNSNVVLSGIGRTTDNNDFITSGSPNYKVLFGCGENVLSGSGFTGELTPYTDAELLALGGTDPFTYFNTDAGEMQYFDGTDYFSLDKTPYSPTPGVTLLSDDFNRANNALVIGNTVVPGSAWPAPGRGVWGISSNEAYCISQATSSGSATINIQQFNVGVSDFDIEVTINRTASTEEAGVVFRYQDASNYLMADVSTAETSLYTVIGGIVTPLSHFTAANPTGTPLVLRVVATGSNIQVYRNGVSVITDTVATFVTETFVGLMVVSGTGFGGSTTFDDLTVI